jgi:hypothetical protein
VAAALLGRHEPLDPVGHDVQADPVVVLDRRERDHRGELGRELALDLAARPEEPRRAHVDHQVDRAVALLDELLDVGRVHPRRDVPVDRPDVVAGVVRPDVGEHQAAALEHRVVLAGELLVDQPARDDLDLARLLEQLGEARAGQGTGRYSKIRRTTSSELTSSASAS